METVIAERLEMTISKKFKQLGIPLNNMKLLSNAVRSYKYLES